MNHPRVPTPGAVDPVLSASEVAGLVDHIKRTIWRGTDDEGHRITIVDVGEGRATVMVDNPGEPNSSTVVLGTAALADLADSVSRWLNRL